MPENAFHALTEVVDYPMYVVTCARDGERAGCLVGFTTQCSIDPTHFLVCISQANHTDKIAHGADVLAVHLLAADQRDVAELFGTETGDEVDKFDQCRWEAGESGVPLLTDCPNRFIGRVIDRVELGDHTGYVLDVTQATTGGRDAETAGFRPLTYQQVRHLDPGHPA
jgi:flavin reductase (DIM6/NTAB) family NADH-FMN oxidoreductase RutF